MALGWVPDRLVDGLEHHRSRRMAQTRKFSEGEKIVDLQNNHELDDTILPVVPDKCKITNGPARLGLLSRIDVPMISNPYCSEISWKAEPISLR